MTPTIRLLSAQDLDAFTALVYLFEDVFEMEDFTIPPPEHLAAVLGREGFMAMVAEDKGKVIGGLTAYTLDHYYQEQPYAYLYDLAVDRDYQRQGIGKQLITALNVHCQEQGYEEVFVQADRDEAHVLDFYRGTSPTGEEEVIHFTYNTRT